MRKSIAGRETPEVGSLKPAQLKEWLVPQRLTSNDAWASVAGATG
jgi:hypothetical protein